MRRKYRSVVFLIAALIGTVAVLTPATANEPVRSGTVLGAVFTTDYAYPCNPGNINNPECSAWLSSGCDPALAGREPAWVMSIVDVEGLDAKPLRRFDAWIGDQAYGVAAGVAFGGAVVQFWSEECSWLRSGVSTHRPAGYSSWPRDYFWVPHSAPPEPINIPAGARWMTVTGNDNLNTRWSLT